MRFLRDLSPSPTAAIFSALSAFLAVPAQAQTGSVTGMVQDAGGLPVAGAQVSIEGTSVGGLANQSGRYLLTNVPTGDQNVTVTMIGHATTAIVEKAMSLMALVRDPSLSQVLFFVREWHGVLPASIAGANANVSVTVGRERPP